MGGAFAVPFVTSPGPFFAAGYVTVAGTLPALGSANGRPARSARGSAPAAWGAVAREVPACLAIFGSEDPRLGSDRPRYEAAFPRLDVVVFAGAPHPAYLRDAAAAHLFTDLVLQFARARHASSFAGSQLLRLTVGTRVETSYFRGAQHKTWVPATVTEVRGRRRSGKKGGISLWVCGCGCMQGRCVIAYAFRTAFCAPGATVCLCPGSRRRDLCAGPEWRRHRGTGRGGLRAVTGVRREERKVWRQGGTRNHSGPRAQGRVVTEAAVCWVKNEPSCSGLRAVLLSLGELHQERVSFCCPCPKHPKVSG